MGSVGLCTGREPSLALASTSAGGAAPKEDDASMTRTSLPSMSRRDDRATFAPNPDYAAHPFLDPDFARRDPHNFRAYARLLRDNLRSPWRYKRFLNMLLHPVNEDHPLEVNERILASYLRDGSAYVARLAHMLPSAERSAFLPDPEIQQCDELRTLVEILFHCGDVRKAFEVRRKLYLAKLLIQIDRTRRVQDGPRHRRYLDEILEKEMWAQSWEETDQEGLASLVESVENRLSKEG